MMMPQEQDGKANTRQPSRRASQGWKNGSCGLDCGHLLEHPLKTGEDHR